MFTPKNDTLKQNFGSKTLCQSLIFKHPFNFENFGDLFLSSAHTFVCHFFQSNAQTHCSTPEACATGSTFTISSAGSCRKGLGNLTTFEGYIYVGWDNILNRPMGPVFATTFDQCRTTPDDLYLLPDDMVVIPVKRINLDRSAAFYASFQDYLSSESQTINLDASCTVCAHWHITVSGSFSKEHQEIKKQFLSESSSMFHTKLEYYAYDVPDQLGGAFHPLFQAQLNDIIDAIQKNMTRRATYLSQLLIRNYGTHVITNCKLGATIAQEDYVDSNTQFNEVSDLDTMRASASVSFYKMFSAGVSDTKITNVTQTSQYTSALRYSKVRTVGGPDVNQLLTATLPMGSTNISQNGLVLVKDLVATDRSGLPLFMVITRKYLPDNPYVDTLRDYIKNATDEYYKKNTVYGCTDPNDENFNFQANVNDSTCIAPANNYTFGGIYQQCSPVAVANGYTAPDSVCEKYRQVNENTGGYSCPPDYEPVLLYTGTIQLDCHQDTYCCHKSCHRCWLALKCCHDVSYTQTDCDTIKLHSYWCRAKVGVEIPPNTGELFGGIYVDGGVNPFTGSTGCPGLFRSYRLGLDMNICMSRDYTLDYRYSKKFQGFFSCQNVQGCTDGFSQHLASSIRGCDVYYCVRPEAFKDFTSRQILRPPYLPVSALINETESSLALFLNGTLTVKQSLKSILEDMYELNVNNMTVKTNTDIIPFSVKNAIFQWSENYVQQYSQNMSDPNPTVFGSTETTF